MQVTRRRQQTCETDTSRATSGRSFRRLCDGHFGEPTTCWFHLTGSALERQEISDQFGRANAAKCFLEDSQGAEFPRRRLKAASLAGIMPRMNVSAVTEQFRTIGTHRAKKSS